MRHALEFRGETVERFRHSRATAYGQLFRDYKALRGRVEALQRRMQQEGPALVLGKVTGVGYQQEIGFQADDRFQRGKSAEIGRSVAEAGSRQ